MTDRFGATPEEWDHFDRVLGLTEDLLPVVSDPSIPISPNSTLKAIGKTPSKLNGENKITGIKEWTAKRATPQEVASWASVPALGICVQTRYARAVDVDIADPVIAQKVWEYLEGYGFPARARENSPKFLLAFRLDGEYAKRVIRTQGGAIEFLATGQQFVAAGTHPSGARYAWVDGLPLDLPAISGGEFEALWKGLHDNFGEGEIAGVRDSQPRRSGLSVSTEDPIALHLETQGWVLSTDASGGQLNIRCPFEKEHTTEGGETATSYFPAGSRGYEQGHFKCLHAHCALRGDSEFLAGVGYGGDWFSDLGPLPEVTENAADQTAEVAERYKLIPVGEYARRPPLDWLIKKLLPKAELAVFYGASEGGKSFLTIDLIMAIVRGVPWQGFKTRQGPAVYLCAEGNGGFPKRLKAYAIQNNVDLTALPLNIIEDVPNLTDRAEVLKVIKQLKKCGKITVIAVDTLAQSMAGADENSGQDVGKVIANCKLISRATGALVLLVHHTGKDISKGARGWSGLRGAADMDMELLFERETKRRTLNITKQKDGDGDMAWDVRLVSVPVDLDEDGDPITSCVVELTPLTTSVPRGVAAAKLGPIEIVVRETFDLLGGMRVEYEALLIETLKVIPPAGSGRDRRKEAIGRAVTQLANKGVFTYRDGYVFVGVD